MTSAPDVSQDHGLLRPQGACVPTAQTDGVAGQLRHFRTALELLADGWEVIESSGSMGEMTLQAPGHWDELGDREMIVSFCERSGLLPVDPDRIDPEHGVAPCPDCSGQGAIGTAAGEYGDEMRDCKRCAGNGEIVVDWETYLHGQKEPGNLTPSTLGISDPSSEIDHEQEQAQ